jgi:hypothetical protein
MFMILLSNEAVNEVRGNARLGKCARTVGFMDVSECACCWLAIVAISKVVRKLPAGGLRPAISLPQV